MTVRCVLPALLGCLGCSTAWDRYENSLYITLKEPQPEVYQRHTELLGEVVQEAEVARRKPPPGILAEYGLYLDRRGRTEEARKYLEAEAQAYPESAVFVAALRRTLERRGPALTEEKKTTPAEAIPAKPLPTSSAPGEAAADTRE